MFSDAKIPAPEAKYRYRNKAIVEPVSVYQTQTASVVEVSGDRKDI